MCASQIGYENTVRQIPL